MQKVTCSVQQGCLAAVFCDLSLKHKLCLSANQQCHVVLGMHVLKMYSDIVDPLAYVSS